MGAFRTQHVQPDTAVTLLFADLIADKERIYSLRDNTSQDEFMLSCQNHIRSIQMWAHLTIPLSPASPQTICFFENLFAEHK